MLRPLTEADAQDYIECHEDKEAKRNFRTTPTTIEEAKKEITGHAFAIMHKGRFAGFIKIKADASVGYGIKKEFRNKGLATRALKEATEYGFKQLKLKRMTARCRSHNLASIRVLEKAGYKITKSNDQIEFEITEQSSAR